LVKCEKVVVLLLLRVIERDIERACRGARIPADQCQRIRSVVRSYEHRLEELGLEELEKELWQ